MKNNGRCVVFLVTSPRIASGIGEAQALALKLSLPIAVVYCCERPENLETLAKIESTLDKYGIPLLVLLGNPKQRLPMLFRHVAPLMVYADTQPNAHIVDLLEGKLKVVKDSSRKLVVHPFSWPGIVMKVADLKPLIEAGVEGC